MHKKIISLIFILLISTIGTAQVELNGTLDLEVAKGGDDSRFIPMKLPATI